ncbi:MAG TPA: glycerophosphodiester phosphodiesterase [Candidatus Binataceae bacterium]|nr:glycerophosphodiester phosphodiesterase [Candidatus Binataceae bacterium]
MAQPLDSAFFDPNPPRVIAHRGGAGLRPENTLAAFAAAHSLGARYFELDVHATRDGILAVCHDPDLGRTTDRHGAISALTYAELAALDGGYHFAPDRGFPYRGQGIRVPRLEEVLAAFMDSYFVIEIKPPQASPLPAILDRVLEATSMRRRVLIASEHQAPLSEMRRLAPEIPTGFSASEVAQFWQAFINHQRPITPAQALQLPPQHGGIDLVTADSVAMAHQLGIEIHVWTVNDRTEMRRLLDLGVDGIITDYPDRALAEIA